MLVLQAIVAHHAPTALAPFQAVCSQTPAGAAAAAWVPSTDTLLSAARRALQSTCQHLGILPGQLWQPRCAAHVALSGCPNRYLLGWETAVPRLMSVRMHCQRCRMEG